MRRTNGCEIEIPFDGVSPEEVGNLFPGPPAPSGGGGGGPPVGGGGGGPPLGGTGGPEVMGAGRGALAADVRATCRSPSSFSI